MAKLNSFIGNDLIKKMLNCQALNSQTHCGRNKTVFSVSQSGADIIGKVGPVRIIAIIHQLSGIVNFLHGQATVERGVVLNE